MQYSDDDMLMLSGIQHYMFCPRQWALIHLEQLWDDNRLTVEGEILHERVDDPFYREKNGGKVTLRSVHIASHELGFYGITDAVELIPAAEGGIAIDRHPGRWNLFPVFERIQPLFTHFERNAGATWPCVSSSTPGTPGSIRSGHSPDRAAGTDGSPSPT